MLLLLFQLYFLHFQASELMKEKPYRLVEEPYRLAEEPYRLVEEPYKPEANIDSVMSVEGPVKHDRLFIIKQD